MITTRDASWFQNLGDSVAKILKGTFPSLHHIERFADNVYRHPTEEGGQQVYVGRETTAVLIEGYATLAVECTCDAGITLVFKYKQDGEWVTHRRCIDPTNVPENYNEARDLIAERAKVLVTGVLWSRWHELSEATDTFEALSEEAARYGDFHGERVRFERQKGVTPPTAWKIINDSCKWQEDRAPVDGEVCWLISNWGQPYIAVAQIRQVQSHGPVACFEVWEILPRPVFSKGDLCLPESEPVRPLTGPNASGMIIPRTDQSDAMARVVTAALEALDTEKDRRKVIEAAFGNILKPIVDQVK